MYTLQWRPSARGQLADLWSQASDRSAITSAVATIDRLLQRNPEDQGESRAGSTRVAFVPPLGVLFDVQEQDRIVTVLNVWRVSKRQGGP